MGNISDFAIEQAVEGLNSAYNETFNYYFTLDTVTRTMSDDWFNVPSDDAATYSAQETAMRDSLSVDPVHYYNILSSILSYLHWIIFLFAFFLLQHRIPIVFSSYLILLYGLDK